MSAYFQNTFLPNANASGVCGAISRWHALAGYQPDTERQLFNYRHTRGERRVFVLWNQKWCVVLHGAEVDEAREIRDALREFPVVVQLWAREGGWGYRLEEHGNRVTSYCSKRGLEAPDESRARSGSSVSRLVAACGVPGAQSRLERNERAHFFFTEKACSEFVQALDVPVGLLTIHDLDPANAGIAEERTVCGWNCRMLCFRKPSGQSNQKPMLRESDLNEEQKAELARLRTKMKPWRKWSKLVYVPLTLLTSLLVIPFMLFMLFLAWLCSISWLRRLFLGASSRFCEDFITQLKAAEPKRLQFQSNQVINTRHGCAITLNGHATALPEFSPVKGYRSDDPVFEINLGKIFLSCSAYPPNGKPRWGGVDVLETSTFLVSNCDVLYQKRRTTNARHQYFQYEWTLDAPRAAYQFFCTGAKELPADELAALESIVKSFQPRVNAKSQ